LIEVSGELDFLIPRRGHFAERAFEVFLHLGPHGVELQPKLVDLSFRSAAHRT